MRLRSHKTSAFLMRFSSCRTFPGQAYFLSAMSAFGVNPFTFESYSSGGTAFVTANVVADAPLRMCVFAECAENPGIPVFLCGNPEQMVEQSPLGRYGCCNESSSTLVHACPDFVRLWMRIDASDEAPACMPFTLEYLVNEPGA